MLDANAIEKVVRQVLAERLGAGKSHPSVTANADACPLTDIADVEHRREILVRLPRDPEALRRWREATPARIGIGRCGCRYNTRSLLLLLADHAGARDSVMADVREDLLDALGLFTVQSECVDRNQHLTRPDLGRRFSTEALDMVREKCTHSPQVQVYASDGLSSSAVNANLANFLPALSDGLKKHGLREGTRFFVRFGRVPSMDVLGPALDAEAVCLLIGERPGLGCAESMSAYLCHRPEEGMPEARRTVISNIHAGGIPAVEAGAYTADVLKKIVDGKKSGVDLKL